MADEQMQRWLEQIDAKLDRLLALEARVAVLEARSGHHDEIAREVASMRDLGPLREKVVSLETAAKATSTRVDTLEKQAVRHGGLADGVKLVWFMLAGAPGAVAIIMQLASMFKK